MDDDIIVTCPICGNQDCSKRFNYEIDYYPIFNMHKSQYICHCSECGSEWLSEPWSKEYVIPPLFSILTFFTCFIAFLVVQILVIINGNTTIYFDLTILFTLIFFIVGYKIIDYLEFDEIELDEDGVMIAVNSDKVEKIYAIEIIYN